MPDRRRAWVSIRNDTGQPMLGISLVHKYSNVYKDEKQWETLGNGELTKDPLAVDYNTGFLTTGKDWWLITWFHPDMKRIWYSSPNNLRGLFDFGDKLLPDVIAGAAGAAAGLVTSFTGPGAIAAGGGAASAATLITSSLFNSGTTDGFKQHMLEKEDEGQLMEIVIHRDTVEFKSKSGTSSTNVGSTDVPQK
jgi:hypothetical protein